MSFHIQQYIGKYQVEKNRELSIKISHKINPVKALFECFKLDMENSCYFCGVTK